MEVHEYRVLLAVGRRAIAEELRQDLRSIGFTRITQTSSGYDALMTIKKDPVDVVLIEYDLPDLSGLEVVRHLRRIPRFPGPRMLLVTHGVDRETVREAASLHVKEFLICPFTPQLLKDRIERLLDVTLI